MGTGRIILVAASLALALVTSGADAVTVVSFPDGVGAGDVRQTSAVLWTRTDLETWLKADVSTDPGFAPAATMSPLLVARASNDLVGKTVVSGLLAGQQYYYRFRRGYSVSETGTFRTAPEAGVSQGLRFAFSGDSDATQIGGERAFGDFLALDSALAEGVDFFAYVGDTVNADSELRPEGPARTLDDYRAVHRLNRLVPAFRRLMAGSSVYTIWDDHEVYNNFDAETVSPYRYSYGRRAFLENMPLLSSTLSDPACVAPPLFRTFNWGTEANIIVLDERSCRSASAEAACLVEVAPKVFATDLAPTLPEQQRTSLNSTLPDTLKPRMQPLPPPGCLEAIRDPARTMLGTAQKEAFKAALLNSTARFKFVVNEVLIQQIFSQPYDKWEGYAAEREEILNFIRGNEITGVIFLTADLHASLVNDVFIDTFTDSQVVAQEFVTGPIGAPTWAEHPLIGDPPPPGSQRMIDELLRVAGIDCQNLDRYSYGVVEVDAAAGTATVTLKEETGAVLNDELHPEVECRKTVSAPAAP